MKKKTEEFIIGGDIKVHSAVVAIPKQKSLAPPNLAASQPPST